MPSVADSGSSLSETVKFTLCLEENASRATRNSSALAASLPPMISVQTVDEDTGDIAFAGMQTADKAEQACTVANWIIRLRRSDASSRDIESQLLPREMQTTLPFSSFYCSVDLINKLLWSYRTGTANNKFYHSFILQPLEVAISVP